MTKTELEVLGYFPVKQLPNGKWAGVMEMRYTAGLFVGLDKTGYSTRFCFTSWVEAVQALEEWDGTGLPPGFWTVQKLEEVTNPLRGVLHE